MKNLNLILLTLFFTTSLGGRIGDEDKMKERVFEIKIITCVNFTILLLLLIIHCRRCL